MGALQLCRQSIDGSGNVLGVARPECNSLTDIEHLKAVYRIMLRFAEALLHTQTIERK